MEKPCGCHGEWSPLKGPVAKITMVPPLLFQIMFPSFDIPAMYNWIELSQCVGLQALYIGLIQVKEEGWMGFSKGWQG